jgi:MFS family permease
MTVFPFIIKRVYDGDAMLLAGMMIVFYGGAMLSNLLMVRFMPFARPGRWFLLLQLSRIIIVYLLWIEPSWWLLVLTIIAWGLNMGITSTVARTIVQESADEAYRGRILSVFNLGLLGSAPIGALVLGWIIESFGTLNALIPSMVVSFVLFIYGVYFTAVWDYRSPTASVPQGS